MSVPLILIVEDNALVAKFYRLALERAGGYSCVITEDVREILSLAQSGKASLAIVDVSLTGTEWEGRILDGVELTRMLKSVASQRLPVLLATAHAMSGDRERLLKASGADEYLQKPVYEADVLVGKVRALLENR
ncbi:MAG: response regulator [Acidobacteria bacterium]|nr:response regulator [Acidobacteriota bacterium]